MAYIKESNLTTWIDNIICHLYGDSFIGSQQADVINDEVDINKSAVANLQAFQLTSRTNYLKNAIDLINTQFTTTKTANKILYLDENSKFIADIKNDLIETKKIIISDNLNYSLITKLQIQNFRTSTLSVLKADNSYFNLLDELNSEIFFHGVSDSTTKLHTAITISDSGSLTSNVLITPLLIDCGSDISLDINLRDQATTIMGLGVVPDIDSSTVFYAVELTPDARIKTAYKTINPTAIKQDEAHRMITDVQVNNWDNKIDSTFIPAAMYGNETSLNNINQGSILKFSVTRNASPETTLASTTIGVRSRPSSQDIDHGFIFESTTNGVKRISAKILDTTSELFGTHNYVPANYAPLNNPQLTGVPTAPTAQVELNSTSLQIANLDYVLNAIKKSDEDKWNRFQDIINTLLTNKHHTYNPLDCSIYQNIFTAVSQNLIAKGNSNTGYDGTTYATAKWNDENMIRYGTGVAHDFIVRIPVTYDMIWLRVTNDRWNIFGIKHGTSTPNNATFNQETSNTIARYSAGFRNLINFSPDGGLPDSGTWTHKWVSIPVDKNKNNNIVVVNGISCREVTIYGGKANGNTPGDNWISGLAFSMNPFKHTSISGIGIYWGLNNHEQCGWNSQDWNRDNLAYLAKGGVRTIRIPVIDWVNETEDRLFYVVGHNDNWNSLIHRSVACNGTTLERLRTTYINPFEKHFNNPIYSNYAAARIPASIIANCDGFLTFTIDVTKNDDQFYFREMGIHKFIP